MNLSQSSKTRPDPLSDVLTALGANIARCTRLEAAGEWALSFPALDRLKFVALLRGTAWLIVPDQAPQPIIAGDVCLIGRVGYTVASDPELRPSEGQALYVDHDTARLGGDETVALGGAVTFHPGNTDFLLDMLPDLLMVPRSSPTSSTVRTILVLLDAEAERDAMGSRIVGSRLADVLLVEAIRAYAESSNGARTGWLGALCDARLGRALHAIHRDIAQQWTVAKLAGTAGMSRAAFAAAFNRQVGQPPLGYVRAWRLTLARAALTQRDPDIAGLAGSLGYTSQSAFTHAFRRAFGVAPKALARSSI